MPPEESHQPPDFDGAVDLARILASTGDRSGVVWTLGGSGDLNANLVRFGAGRGVGEHVNAEVDVLFLGVSGEGIVRVDGREHGLSAGVLVFAPQGSARSTRAVSERWAYLTVHRRRGLPGVGPPARPA